MIKENIDRFDDWEEMLHNLQYVYTISFKDACRIFKASRTWVNRYIRPNVRCLYLSNRFSEKSHNWVAVASKRLNKPMTEKIWFHTEDFIEFIEKCVYSTTKQTRNVVVTELMTEENTKKYYKELNQISNELKNETNIRNTIKLQKELCNSHENYLKNDEKTKKLYENRLSSTSKRSNVIPVPVNVDIKKVFCEWVAPHELKDYGDTDELVYRMLFVDSYIKIVLHVPDIDGIIGEKIFYTRSNMHNLKQNKHEQVILVAEKDWIEYNQE